MRTFLWIMAILSTVPASAQGPSFQNLQRTTGTVGIIQGQTARLNVLYPTAPAPILQPLCTITLLISDDQGNVLKSEVAAQLVPGKSLSISLNADTDLSGGARTEIHGVSIGSGGCSVVTSLELFDNATQKTLLMTGSDQTFPYLRVVSPLSPAPPVAEPTRPL